jgi:hypothetical protein
MRNDLLITFLVANAYSNYSASIMSNPLSEKRFDYHKNPKLGDLVMEISTIGSRYCDRDRIGYLKDFDGWSAYEIETLDGRTFTWDNANMIRIPQEPFEITKIINKQV